MDKDAKILVAGASGLVGSALVRELTAQGYENVLEPSHAGCDFLSPEHTKWFFSVHEPSHVFFCAAKVGGIADNSSNKIGFLCDNLHMELNAMENAAAYGVEKFLFVGTSCVYPKDCPQPMQESSIWTGPLEPATEAYSIAKLVGLQLCRYYQEEWSGNFVCALPCNVFGPSDEYDPHRAHCLPGLISRMHQAKTRGDKSFPIWGDGRQQRELIYSDDLARGLITAMQKYESPEPINVGSGFELSIGELAHAIADVMEYRGQLVYDESKPTGAVRKLLDNSKISALGWAPQEPFRRALLLTYSDFLRQLGG